MRSAFSTCLLLLLLLVIPEYALTQKKAAKKLNFIFILSDDHRYDFMDFTGKVPWLKTPGLNQLKRTGVWVKNATVTTALCSPSRASILTGQYAHTHQVVDNFSAIPNGLTFFPQHLQKAGYTTCFLGKWHMGNTSDQPQQGFDHWESFEGQGVYYKPRLNINGQHYQYDDTTYITDLLTNHAIQWLDLHKTSPFFMYISHKGVHDEFMPAKRHKGVYVGQPILYPSTINLTATKGSRLFGDTLGNHPTSFRASGLKQYNVADIPQWVVKQRNSWHGVDFMYDGRVDFEEFYRRYAETLLSVDESVATIIKYLEDNGLRENTVIIYMGDNGFLMGEHGLIDKRNMYEESQRVPMLISGPGNILSDIQLSEVIQNIDVAPTILDLAAVKIPPNVQGKSFAPLLRGEKIPWRNRAFYEYYWEFSYPQTPTTFGVRTNQFKFIFYPGTWDISELYDLFNDPEEKNNLYRHPAYQDMISSLRKEVWDWLEKTGGMQIPLKRINEKRIDWGYKGLY
jgi:arylsulfatase A-like enzyme